MESQDQINQAAWTQPAGISWLAHLEGFTDRGERAAYDAISRQFADGPILDLGVGGGRTVDLLRTLSADYVAIDYTPELVESAHRKYPDVDIRLGDARELSAFADGHFSLVVFSYMGIDSVNHEDRQRILREVRRVLKPAGMFWFSTLNLAGSAARERPWLMHLPSVRGWCKRSLALGKALKRMPRELFNYLRVARGKADGTGWSVAPFFAYSYGLLMHYTTLENELVELMSAGFQKYPEVFEDGEGARVSTRDDLSCVCCFNVLARR